MTALRAGAGGFLAGALVVGAIWLARSGEGLPFPSGADLDGSGTAAEASAAALTAAADSTGLDERVADAAFRDLDDEVGTLSSLLEGGPLVVVMRDAGCPVARKYGHEVARIEEAYRERGVSFLYLNVSGSEAREAARAEVELFGFDGPYALDPEGRVRSVLEPRTTTEVFVIDEGGVLRYRGAVDDQYGIDFAKPEPRRRFLRDALDAVLAGGEVPRAATFASGCFLGARGPERHADAEHLTFHGRVSRILQDNCVTCHRDGGVGPFALTGYETAYRYRGMIRYMVSEGRMPPWFAHPDHGEWANDRSLRPEEKLDLLSWIASGAPEGDPADAPEPKAWVSGWQLGEPDAVVELDETFSVPAEGVVDYQYFYLKTDFPEDRWISKMEIRPTRPQVVHHVLVFVEDPEAEDRRGGIDGYFAAMVPGFTGNVYPEGTAKLLPKGAWLKFQVHYTPNGRAVEDRTRLGFHFAGAPPERVVETRSAYDVRFEIPPHASNHRVRGVHTFRRSGRILSFFPHMHVRGKAFRYELVRNGGEREILLDIPRYDFNWQLAYHPAEPIGVEPGDRLVATGWYDNSEANPANPDPTETVRFGEQTFEEMMIGYFDWVARER